MCICMIFSEAVSVFFITWYPVYMNMMLVYSIPNPIISHVDHFQFYVFYRVVVIPATYFFLFGLELVVSNF